MVQGNRPPLSNEKQLAYFAIKESGRSISATARLIDVGYLELRNSIYGRVRPTPAVRQRLPLLLGRDLSELFDAGSLRAPRGSELCDCAGCSFKRFRAVEQAGQHW